MAFRDRDFVVGLAQPTDSIFELIPLWRRAFGLDELESRMPVDVLAHLLEIGMKPPQANGAHREFPLVWARLEAGTSLTFSGDFSVRSASGGGARSSRLSSAMANPIPSLTLLSAVQVLMPSK